jgi:hypothetical protein
MIPYLDEKRHTCIAVSAGGCLKVVKKIPRASTLVDFDVADRLIAFVYSSDCDPSCTESIVVYRFDMKFSVMETVYNIDLHVKTTLQLPLSHIFIFRGIDSRVVCVGQTGHCQSLCLRSSQASPRVSLSLGHTTHIVKAACGNAPLLLLMLRVRGGPALLSCARRPALADVRDLPLGEASSCSSTRSKR